MAVERGLLIIADIAGYTSFMRLHRLSLAHAEDVTGRLLKAVIGAASGLRLVEIEGDAAFFYASLAAGEAAAKLAAEQARAMHDAFHRSQSWMVERNMCSCEGCRQAGRLRLKFVAHFGEVASQTIKRRTKLVGVDVIVVHRMLKNRVPVAEYILLSPPLYEHADAELRARARPVEQELEGLSDVRAYFIDIGMVGAGLPPPCSAAFGARVVETLGVALRGMPYLTHLKRPRLSARGTGPNAA